MVGANGGEGPGLDLYRTYRAAAENSNVGFRSMEMLIFYWPNLVAGALIAAGLGLVGLHIFARHQALEAFVLGQEIQTSIIVIAYALIGLGQHSDHGFHVETIFSLGLAFAMHLLYLRVIGKRHHLRMEYS